MANPAELFGRKAEQETHYEKLPQPVYYIESSDDDTVLVGIDVEIKQMGDAAPVVTWYDTSHERSMSALEMVKKDDYFAFRSADKKMANGEPAEYYFAPMDLNTYREKVKDKLIEGRDFESEEEMINAFLEAAKKNGEE